MYALKLLFKISWWTIFLKESYFIWACSRAVGVSWKCINFSWNYWITFLFYFVRYKLISLLFLFVLFLSLLLHHQCFSLEAVENLIISFSFCRDLFVNLLIFIKYQSHVIETFLDVLDFFLIYWGYILTQFILNFVWIWSSMQLSLVSRFINW